MSARFQSTSALPIQAAPLDRGPRRARSLDCLTAIAAIAAAVCVWAVGCADSRISVQALKELESQVDREMADDDIQTVEPAELGLRESHPYRVGPGDVLSVTLLGAADTNDPYAATVLRVRVDDEGKIRLPLVGALEIAGLNLNQIEKAVIDAHVPDFVKDVTVHVEVVSAEVTTVIVSGAAAQRGMITLASNERNVLYALALAGGYAVGTSGVVTVRPLRPDAEERVYNLTRPDDVRRAMLAAPLESGDMIIVEAASNSAVYMTGLVNTPGPIAVPPDSSISLVRAVSAAGGLVDLLNPKEATLWRKMPDGQQVRVKVNIADIMAGEEPDLALRPGDILDVPHTAETRVLAWVLANVRLGPFSLGASYDPIAERRFQDALDDRGGLNAGFGQSVLDTIRFGLPNIIVPPVVPQP